MNREELERPFEGHFIKSRQGAFGQSLHYVEAHHVVQRLNDALDGLWAFEVVEHLILDNEVVVLGKLSADGIAKTAFGGSAITKNRSSGEVLSIADDLKAAATDALKKAASLFGVGLHLYGEDLHQQDAAPARPPGPPLRAVPPSENGNGGGGNSDQGGNGNNRLTARQLNAIWALSRQAEIPQREIRRHSMDRFGKQPEFLSRQEASEMINTMQAGR